MRYIVTIKDKIRRWCRSCEKSQYIYAFIDDDGETKVCCTVCQFIIENDTVPVSK